MHPKWLILSSVACGTFMATLDSSIVNVALPSITSSLNTGLLHSRWVIISYLFSITGLLLFFGKLSDIIGRKTIFNIGYVTFTLGSFLCGLSSTIQQLILFRGFQGFGAAMLMANGPAIITAAFPANERGKALGTLAMVVSAGLAIGPTLGGLLVRFFSWPSIFFVNIPVGILGIYLVYRHVPVSLGIGYREEDEGSVRECEQLKKKFEEEQALPFFQKISLYIQKLRYFDWLGAILWMFIQFGYSLAIDQENVLGLAGPLQKLITFGSVGLLILFLIWEWSIQEPILNLSLFKSKVFLAANISGFFNFVAISSVTLLTPFYLQSVRGIPPHQVGLLMTAIPLTIFFVAPISGRLSDQYGSRILSTLGMLILCLTMGALALPQFGLVSENPSVVTIYLVLVGLGVGLFQSPNNNTIMGAVSKTHLGVASALLATVRNFGLVTGVALSTSLLMYFHDYSDNAQISVQDSFITALRYTYFTLACICSIAIFTSSLSEKTETTK